MTALNKYHDAVVSLPASGGGGCNQALLGAANHGVHAGVDPQQIHNDLRNHVHGARVVSDREIKRAVNKAIADKGDKVIHYDFEKKKQKPAFDGDRARQKIMVLGEGIQEVDIWAASPIRIDWEPEADPQHLFDRLYQPADWLFMGGLYSPGILGKTIRRASEWTQYSIGGGKIPPHVMPNPLTGKIGITQDGKETLRGDACIQSFRFAVIEFDNLTHAEQLAFWWGVNLPVVALIDSGNKSIHGWVKIDGVATSEEWTLEVEQQLFKNLLMPMGVDGACRNEARLSRLPGHQREGGRMQKLLYLAPSGRRVNG